MNNEVESRNKKLKQYIQKSLEMARAGKKAARRDSSTVSQEEAIAFWSGATQTLEHILLFMENGK